MEGPPPEYLPEVDYAAPVESWTFRNYATGKTYKLVLFPSRRRRDAFRVLVNGREWSRGIGYDRLLRQTRKVLSARMIL